MTRTAQKNTQVFIFSGLSPDDITATTRKMDFKESKEKICGGPIYCRAWRNLTPTKENAEAKENEKNEGEKEHINEENVDKPTENKIAKIPKPKFKSKAVENSYLNRIDKFLTPTQPLKSLFASAVFTGEVSPEDNKTPSGDKRNASQLERPGSSPEEKAPPKQLKKDKASSIPVGFGAMSGQK